MYTRENAMFLLKLSSRLGLRVDSILKTENSAKIRRKILTDGYVEQMCDINIYILKNFRLSLENKCNYFLAAFLFYVFSDLSFS